MRLENTFSCEIIFRVITNSIIFIFLFLIISIQAHAVKDNSLSPKNQLKTKYAIANQLLQQAQYKKATHAFVYLVEHGKGKIKQDSLEMLGVSYEYRKLTANAKATYNKYIATYKKGDSTDRVKQRLAHLLEEKLVAVAPLSLKNINRKSKLSSRHNASIMQYFYISNNNYDEGNYVTDQSLLYTYINSDWRKRKNHQELKTRLSIRYTNDLEENEHGPLDVKNAFIAYRNAKQGSNLKLGRQSGHAFGIGNRFDGISGGYSLSSGIAANLIFGSPVSYYKRASINTDEHVYGANLLFISKGDRLEVDSYFIQHQHQSHKNRSAIGSNIRWQEKLFKLYGATDYDIFYKTYNLIQLHSELTLKDNDIFLHYDNRRSPFIESSTALLAVTGLEDMDELHEVYSEDQIKQLALDLTGRSTSVRAGIRHQFNRKITLSSSAILAEHEFKYLDLHEKIQNNREKSGTLNTRLVAQRYTKFNETNILNLRFIKASRYNSFRAQVISRFRPQHRIQFNIKFKLNYRKLDSHENQTLAHPAFSLKFRIGKKAEISTELGRTWIWYGGRTINDDYQRNFLNIGYLMRF